MFTMNRHRFTLESLRHTVAVDAEGSFSAAARVHGVAQPTLSNSVAKLERQLGNDIFTRSPQGVAITDFGEKILPLIKSALSSLDNISHAADLIANPRNQRLRIGTTTLVDPNLLAGFQNYLHSLPTAPEIILTEASAPLLSEQLASDELDLILIPAVAPMKGFEHRIIDSEPMMAVGTSVGTNDLQETCPGTHQGQPIDIKDLDHTTLILPPLKSGLGTLTNDLLATYNVEVHKYPGEPLTCTTMENWAALGFGIALLPASQVSPTCRDARPLYESGHEVEIFYEAVWNPLSPLRQEVSTAISRISKKPDMSKTPGTSPGTSPEFFKRVGV